MSLILWGTFFVVSGKRTILYFMGTWISNFHQHKNKEKKVQSKTEGTQHQHTNQFIKKSIST